MDRNDPSPSSEERRAARLLVLARSAPRRSVDLLLEELSQGSPGRLEELLTTGPAAPLASPNQLLEGVVTPETLARATELCKAQPDAELEHRLQALATYFTSVAAALAHHGVLLTRRPFVDLEPILVDLAACTRSPWSELFERALERGQGDGAKNI